MFVIFFISALAETNRPPFDLPEAEAELVAGYQTEYSGMMYAMFWLGEYANILLMCAMGLNTFFRRMVTNTGYLPHKFSSSPSMDDIKNFIFIFIICINQGYSSKI